MDHSSLILNIKVSWGYRQALLSHHSCHILPVPPDPFPAPLGCPLEKKWWIKSVIKGLQPAQMAFLFCDWLTLSFPGKNHFHAQRRVPHIPSAKVTWQAWGAPSGPRHPGETPCRWAMSAKLQPYSSQQAKLSTMASLSQLKSSFSFSTWRLLLPDQPLGHANCWQSQQDNGCTTAIHYTTLNILPDLLLCIQTHYIPHPTHQMLSG